MSTRVFGLGSALLIAILGFSIYGNSLKNPFIWDDLPLVKENVRIRHGSGLGALFTESISGKETQTSSYRPLQMFTYLLDYSLWKSNPAGFRLTNVGLHILAALCLLWLILGIFKDRFLALLTSILFTIHPVHTEAVTYISGRADMLVAIFLFGCLAFYNQYVNDKKPWALFVSSILFAFALLSKEYALILPGLIGLYHWVFNKRFEKKAFFALSTVGAFYLGWRSFHQLGSWNVHSQIETSVLERIPGAFAAITQYIKLLIYPFDLHMGYGQALHSASDPKVVLGIVLFFCLVLTAFRFKTRHRLTCFALLWFLLSLLPILNIYPINAWIAEHWLYIPSVGFFLILSFLLKMLYCSARLKPISILLILGLGVFWSHLTIQQNTLWSKPIDFYKRVLTFNPSSFEAHNNLGMLLDQKGKLNEAAQHYLRSIQLNPTYEETYYNLGVLFSRQDRHKEAMVYYSKALQIWPAYVKAHNNLANSYAVLGLWDKAMEHYAQALRLNPGYADAHSNLGNVLLQLKEKKQALYHYKKAIELNPAHLKARCNLAALLFNQGKTTEAIQQYSQALNFHPRSHEALNGLGLVYFKTGKTDQAETAFQSALKVDPRNDTAKSYLKMIAE